MIIHSPIVSGSLTFASGATFTLPTGGVYSGSFSGSYQGVYTGNGSGLTFGGTGIVSGSSQLTTEFDARYLNTSGDGIVSSSAQVTELLPNGTVSGSSQIVSILSPLNTFSASEESKNSTLATYTGSVDTTLSNLATKNNTLETYTSSLETKNSTLATYTGSVDTKNNTLGTYTASLETKNSTLATYTGSIDTKNDTLGTYTASLETKNSTLATYTGSNDTKWSTLGSLSGSFARINSTNTFDGSQTISGSLFITQDLVVLGSSSIQNISSSRLDIGDNIIQLNVNQPAVRFGGIAIFDSGSTNGSGSFLYDSVHDEFIFVHRGNGTNITSSHFLMGPETIDNLGNETYLTNNRLPKSTGNEHLVDSNITDTGTLITLGSNTVVSGTLLATGTSLVSGSSQITLSSTTGGGTSANVQFNSLGIGMAASATAGRIDATNDIVAYSSSDIRFKENIKPIENPLEKISKISGNTYDWKQENHIEHGYEGNDVGVIAQEIEEVLPQLVQTRENGYKAVKYDKLVALLIEGIKEQQSKIEELTNRINKLESGL